MPRFVILVGLALFVRLVVFALVLGAAHFAQFDSSARLLTASLPTQSILRWELFHFVHIAEHGHFYEHEWAFFPGSPFIMKSAAHLYNTVSGGHTKSIDAFLWPASLLCTVATLDMPRILYRLTYLLFKSENFAFLTAALSLLPSSPVTLFIVPYTEPLFTYLTYRGLLCCAQLQWFQASTLFMLAGAFRSNGILLAGFTLWGLLINPSLSGKRVGFWTLGYSTCLAMLVLLPFVYHHLTAYFAFCVGRATPIWCSRFPPSIYTYVQAKYWNMGFLNYWKKQQIPNFIIAVPPLAAILVLSIRHTTDVFIPRIRAIVRGIVNQKGDHKPHLSDALTPHALHAIFLCTTLIFASHIQIVLRFAATMPITYWAAAWLVVEHPTMGRLWIVWSIFWGLTASVLWGSFLPPA